MEILETLKNKVNRDFKNDIENVKAMITGDNKKTIEKFSDICSESSMCLLILLFILFVIIFR